jgi:hypothetical protein
MPQTLAIGVLVLGGILLLIALLGGNFKLFGAEISESVSSKGLTFPYRDFSEYACGLADGTP